MSDQIKNSSTVKTYAPSIDSTSVKNAFSTKVAASSFIKKQRPQAVTPFHIKNSSLAKGMWCSQDKNGFVSCHFEECEVGESDAPDKCKSEFEVQDILDRGYIEMVGDYWGHEWDEQYIY